MMNNFNANKNDEPNCRWCGAVFDQPNASVDKVCEHCYRLLLSANLSDEEIFSDRRVPLRSTPNRIREIATSVALIFPAILVN